MANTNCNPTSKQTGTIDSFIRNHYFYGKLLTVSDFQLEQNYVINKLRLHNKLLQGKGILNGLRVTNLTSNSENVTFTLSSGHAIDGDGHVILLNSERTISLENSATDKANFYICINYIECEQDSVPIATNGSQCGEEDCCYNRIEESYNITLEKSASPCPHSTNCNPTSIIEEGDIGSTNTQSIVLAVIKNNHIDDEETAQYRCTITSNQVLQEILCNHLEDENPHDVVTSLNRLKSDVTLSPSNTITITPNGQNITIGESHSTQKENPHETKHNELLDIKGFGTVANATKNKHISNSDAIKWNSYNINGIHPNTKGQISLRAGNNITITNNQRQNSITISAEATTQSFYSAVDFIFPNSAGRDKSTHIIEHGWGRFPVVDVYYLYKEIYIKYVPGQTPIEELSIMVRQIDEKSIAVTARRNNEPFEIILKIILVA